MAQVLDQKTRKLKLAATDTADLVLPLRGALRRNPNGTRHLV
jgi:hypothetical protein